MNNSIPAILPRGNGHQFVLYGDSCSGVPGALHEKTFAAVNAVVQRLRPQPEFILFPGDEIIGLTPGVDALRAQWRHWFDTEMAWLDRAAIPIWHTTGNHTTYDLPSEAVFRSVLDLPNNGPPGQAGLSYFVRRGDLLMVFANTLWSGLGGEGHVEIDWLEATLRAHGDARHKLVLGHHPVFPVNGFTGTYQREIGHEYARPFWDVLVNENVLAYLCSHILAFDVQAHRGVLQICTAGAGTAHRMPEGVEYLHCVQAALDEHGLRYQVLDVDGALRERMEWPLPSPDPASWRQLPSGEVEAMFSGHLPSGRRIELRLSGQSATTDVASAQTIFTAFSPGSIAPFWLGLRGPKQTLTAIVGRDPGRSPSYWFGPDLPAGESFDIHVLLYPDMGPGGLLYRHHDTPYWSSFNSATARGLEQLPWPRHWAIGHGQGGGEDRPFRGAALDFQIAQTGV
ncbi:metallophosphoesterase family protein [Bradyrhizobium sp. 930_D9_N1_4]|uniref:metallophosphoesterase family protein n=1 Tax=Bradyrhizobium sp. 930_D9_N1_4 TaxID=3240374 RepID=UPI003F8C851C